MNGEPRRERVESVTTLYRCNRRSQAVEAEDSFFLKISPMNSRDGSSSLLQTIATGQPALMTTENLMFRIPRFFQLGALAVVMGLVVGASAAERKDTPDTALFVKLVDAARLGDVTGVNRALNEGADINRVDGWPTPRPGTPKPVQRTALFHAMQAGRPETSAVLIERGVDVVTVMDGQTPLGWAGTFGDMDSLLGIWAKLREAERAELLRKNESWEGALEYGQIDAVKELERLGFSLRGADGGTRALNLAVASGRLECVDHVLALNLKSLDGHWNGVTALARAAGQGDVAIMQRLLDRGAAVDVPSMRLADEKSWQAGYRVTPLVTAVIKGEPEAVAVLLKRGAKADALENQAIRWADLLGDETSFRLLRNAGAPEPGAFSFKERIAAKTGYGRQMRTSGMVEAGLTAMLASGAPRAAGGEAATVGELARPTKLAIVPLSPGLENAEALLAAQLSGLAGATVLERADVRRIAGERALIEGFGRSPSENKRLGGLLGADALVVLQLNRQGDASILEARVVSVATGLVTSLQATVWDATTLERWVGTMVRQVMADEPRIFTAPENAKLVAVVPLTASTTGPTARETERRLTLLLSAQLARLPGVFLVERRELDRLRLEADDTNRTLLTSSWLVSGSVEVLEHDGRREAENTLSLKVKTHADDAIHTVRKTGVANDPIALVRTAAAEIAGLIAVTNGGNWKPEAEAEVFFGKSKEFSKRRLWGEAQVTAEAAWALGLQNDAVLRQRVETAVRRVMLPHEGLTERTYNLQPLPRTRERVEAECAPLILGEPGTYAREELTFEDYVEQAEGMIEWYARTLHRTDKKFGGQDYDRWLAGGVWDAATLPLQLGEALSYQRKHGTELNALRERLLAVNAEALATAKAGGFATAYHTLLVIRCRLLPWWEPNEARFQDEVLKVLHLARSEKLAMAGHPVWSGVHKAGDAQMGRVSSRSSQAWGRLARRLAKSADAEERFLGLAWLSHDLLPGRRDVVRRQLKEQVGGLLEADIAWAGVIWGNAYDRGKEAGENYAETPWGPWYYNALRASRRKTGFLPDPRKEYWSVGPGGGSDWDSLADVREFDLRNLERKVAVIERRGAACLLNWGDTLTRTGLRDEDLERMMAAIKRVEPVLSEALKGVVGDKPSALNAPEWLRFLEDELAKSRQEDRVSTTPAILFGSAGRLFRDDENLDASDLTKSWNLAYLMFRAGDDIWCSARHARWGRTVFFKIGPQGRPLEIVSHDDQDAGGVMLGLTAINRVAPGGADITDDMFVVRARGRRGAGLSIFSELLRLYDRRAGTWVTLTPSFPVNMIYDVKVLKGTVYFSFLYNHEVDNARGRLEDDYLKKGEPLWGIGEYTIATRSWRLLASSRRSPAESRWDVAGREFRRLIKLSPTALTAEGSTDWIYDLETKEWRAGTAAEQVAIRQALAPVLELEAGGERWKVTGSWGNHGMHAFTVRKGPPREWIHVWIDTDVDLAALPSSLRAHEAAFAAMRSAARKGMYIRVTPAGALHANGNYYTWTPVAEIQRGLNEAVQRMKAGGSGVGSKWPSEKK